MDNIQSFRAFSIYTFFTRLHGQAYAPEGRGIHQSKRALDNQQKLRALVLIARGEHLDDYFTRE